MILAMMFLNGWTQLLILPALIIQILTNQDVRYLALTPMLMEALRMMHAVFVEVVLSARTSMTGWITGGWTVLGISKMTFQVVLVVEPCFQTQMVLRETMLVVFVK